MDGDEGGLPRRRRIAPWQIAALYAVLAIVLAALGFGGLWRDLSLLPEPPASRWASLVTALPAAATVLLRRRAPRLGLGLAAGIFLADALTVGGLVPLLVVLELLHAVILRLAQRQRAAVLSWGIAVLVAVALSIQALLGDVQLTVLIALQLGALFGTTYWYANSVAQSRELVALYRQRATDLARLTELDRAAAVRDERERMASELHDIVAGHVAAVAIRSEAALSLHGPAHPSAAASAAAPAPATRAEDAHPERSALRAVRDSSLQAHEALRTMIAVLRDDPAAPAAAPLGRAQLPGLVAEARRSGLSVELHDGVSSALPAAVDQRVGRIVQEGLANSAKHDSGATVAVHVALRGGGVHVRVVSRGGRALDDAGLRGNGLGLRGLAEGVGAIGGRFRAGPVGSAWEVVAWLPLPESEPGGCRPAGRGAVLGDERA
ncbi:sensor histidine kinase [Leucobacter luti]|uniref:histidine kinase n=1 Tax=Leucobacter luti TaxID=340320 RepID=A0A4V6MCW6_9MICO|nr:histidine kinase [Leucobacter luti]MBL3698624.1 sensor histidine kinase [Leucobacter luti]RZT65999.1 signal transduction histidine kinase [Leucobacter luti]